MQNDMNDSRTNGHESTEGVPSLRALTVAELAEDAFLKSEYVQALRMANTPLDYEARKKAFVQLAEAEAAVNRARLALSSAVANGAQ